MSTAIDASMLLRPGLLDGVHVLVVTASELAREEARRSDGDVDSFASAVASTCAELGAGVSAWSAESAIDSATDMLVVDAAGAFALAGAGACESQVADKTPRDALRECLDGSWEASRAVASTAFIEPGRPGRIVYLAPACVDGPRAPSVPFAEPTSAGDYADAARAGLENLARTLSIEWARFGITLVTIAPGERTSTAEVAAVTAFLGSLAGAYYSGCLFDLRGLVGVRTLSGP
ncbi:MAG TPA: hypothetical protein VGO29_01030 [Solirubrobacteraceae bacterium]|nr:hypothetical protein [Solirubrobacteraceae bacterium]